MKTIYLAFRIIRSIFWINQFNYTGSGYHRQGKRMTEKLTSGVDWKNARQFPSSGKLKMQWYMADSIFACEHFNRLIGSQSTKSDREIYLMAGAILTMSDLVIDDIDMDLDRVKLMRSPSPDFIPKDEIEKLYLTCYNALFSKLKGQMKARTLTYFELLFDAQIKSKRQFDPEATQHEVDKICKEKCGYSTLFLRSLCTDHFDLDQEPLWFELGAFTQFCNDAQDLHKDLKKSLRTFASTRPDIESISRDLEAQRILSFNLIKSASFEEKRKDDFLLLFYVMYLAILAKLSVFSLVCDFQFSANRFLSVDANKLREKTAPVRLLSFILPRAFNYRYASA